MRLCLLVRLVALLGSLSLTAPLAQAASFGTGADRRTIADQTFGLPGSSCSGTYTAPVSLTLPLNLVLIPGDPPTYTLTDGTCTPSTGQNTCGLPPGLTLTGGDTLTGTLAADLRTATAAHYSLTWTVTDSDSSDSLTFEIAIDDERPVLEDLYTHTNGANWTTNTNWAAHIPAATCLNDLHGITLQGNGTGSGVGRVSEINLSSNNLTGEIPEGLGNPGHGHGPYGHDDEEEDHDDHEDEETHEDEVHLRRLKVLNLSHNYLTGAIPAGLNYLSSLDEIDLSYNNLTGEIPEDITDLHFLGTLDLSNNELTGEIPDAVFHEGFTHPGHTEHVNLSHNQLTGPIPKSLAPLMPDLVTLNLSHNKLTGSIPGLPTPLRTLDLSHNELTGEIPSELGSKLNLAFLNLDNNRLSGKIPEEVASLAGLFTLDLSHNRLTEEIPADLSSLSSLNQLTLSHNQLTGKIPATLPPNVTSLDLSNNRLHGEIPAEVASLGNLHTLVLSHNQLTGEVPALAAASSLSTLWLNDNQLDGNLPTSLPNFQLTSLHLHNNQFDGEIPSSMGFIPNLTSLRLSNNKLSGEIPSLVILEELTELWLQDNQLTGEIQFVLPFGLTTLYLHNNRLEGELVVLPVLDQLEELSLYGNPRGSASALYGYPSEMNSRSALSLVVPNTHYTMCLPSTMGGDDCTIPTKVDQLRLSHHTRRFFSVLVKPPSDPAPSGYEVQYRLSSATEWSSSVRFDESNSRSYPPDLLWFLLSPLSPGRSYDVRARTTDSPDPAQPTLRTPWLQTSITVPGEPPSTSDPGSDDPGGSSGFGGGGGSGGGSSRTRAPSEPRNLTAVGGDGAVVLTWDAPEDDGGAAISDYEYLKVGREPWTSTGSTDTTHTVSGLVNGTTYLFEVRAVTSAGTSFASNRAEATPLAPELSTLDFPHFANGEGITSEVVVVNVGGTPVRPVLYFSDQQGKPIAADSVVDVTGDLMVTEDGSLTLHTVMEPWGELTIATHGRGELVSGSLRVVTGVPIGGVVRYSVPDVGVTGVGAGLAVRDALFPARSKQGGIRTAAALHNLGEEAIEVTCRLMSGGVALEEAAIPLEANGQTSWFIEEVFTMTDTTDFAGTVRCTAPGQGRFSGLAVEVDQANRIFTTLPVVEVDRTGGSDGETVLDFAHFANGTWVTDLVFVNPSIEPSGPPLSPFHSAVLPTRPSIYFYDTEGDPIAAESVVDLTGDLEITEDGALTLRTGMVPLGVLTISTHGRGGLVTGSVRVVSEGPIGGMLRFAHPALGVAGVGAGLPVSDAMVPVRRQEGGINTGVALHNLESSSSLLRCELMQAGVLRDSVSIPLAANGQTSWSIDQAFPATDTSDFLGSLRCSAPGGDLFTAVALEMDSGARTFTTLPVVPVPEMPSRE